MSVLNEGASERVRTSLYPAPLSEESEDAVFAEIVVRKTPTGYGVHAEYFARATEYLKGSTETVDS